MTPTGPILPTAAALVALVLGSACAGGETGPPRIALDRSACDGCGMLVSDPQFAAAYRAGGETAVFDDIGCLLRALDERGLTTQPVAAGSEASHAEVWLLDGGERWIQAGEAVFVRSPALLTPMGGGVQAVARRADAEELAGRVGGTIVDDFEELRNRAAPAAAGAAGGRNS